jgi:hypothetical protein
MTMGVNTVRLKKALVSSHISDFPQYGSSYAIALTRQPKSELCFPHVMDQNITDAIVNMSVEVCFEDTAS